MINSNPIEGAPPWISVDRAFGAASRRRGRMPVLAVASGKCGVGKTNIVANLIEALRVQHKRVIAIDAALGRADLSSFFQVDTAYSLYDFFDGGVPLDKIVVSAAGGISLLPGTSNLTDLDQTQKLAFLSELDALPCEWDIALVDTGSGVSDPVTYFASAAQEIVIVITPDTSSLADAYAVLETLTSKRREKRFRVLVNQVTDRREALKLFDTLSQSSLRFLNVSLDFLGWVPYDEQLAVCAASSQTIISRAPDAPASRAITELAERLLTLKPATARIKGSPQFFLRCMFENTRAEA